MELGVRRRGATSTVAETSPLTQTARSIQSSRDGNEMNEISSKVRKTDIPCDKLETGIIISVRCDFVKMHLQSYENNSKKWSIWQIFVTFSDLL